MWIRPPVSSVGRRIRRRSGSSTASPFRSAISRWNSNVKPSIRSSLVTSSRILLGSLRRTDSPLKAIARSPEVREAFHVHGYDAGWQLAQERLFRQKFPLGLRSVDQNNVGGAIFRIGANDFERFLYTLRERRVFRIIDGDGEFINPASSSKRSPSGRAYGKFVRTSSAVKEESNRYPQRCNASGSVGGTRKCPARKKSVYCPEISPSSNCLLTRISPNTLAPPWRYQIQSPAADKRDTLRRRYPAQIY